MNVVLGVMCHGAWNYDIFLSEFFVCFLFVLRVCVRACLTYGRWASKYGGYARSQFPSTAAATLSSCLLQPVCVFFPFILDIKFVRRIYQPGSHRRNRISHPSFCGACLNFSRGKDSAIPFPRRQ